MNQDDPKKDLATRKVIQLIIVWHFNIQKIVKLQYILPFVMTVNAFLFAKLDKSFDIDILVYVSPPLGCGDILDNAA